jgi:hypothetical protein
MGALGVGAAQRDRHQAFAVLEKAVQVVGELGGIDDAEQLDVIVREHQAVVGGAPADVTAARRRPEAEPFVAGPRWVEIAHPDDHVVDARDAIGHGADSRRLAFCVRLPLERLVRVERSPQCYRLRRGAANLVRASTGWDEPWRKRSRSA